MLLRNCYQNFLMEMQGPFRSRSRRPISCFSENFPARMLETSWILFQKLLLRALRVAWTTKLLGDPFPEESWKAVSLLSGFPTIY